MTTSDLEEDFSSQDQAIPKGRVKGPQSVNRKFRLKHVFRGGAIVWAKSGNKDYYLVFKSKSRPNRGIQLPGGRIEREENPAAAVLREVHEETGIDTRIICPLGMIYFENELDNYSSMQIYYLVRPASHLNVNKKWDFTDKDQTKQQLECWFVPVDEDPEFLAAGQAEVVYMFKNWLLEHKKNESENKFEFKHKSKFKKPTN